MTEPERKARGPEEILVVEDNSISLQFLTRVLTENGYRVRPATDGPIALQSVAARLPDLILLDVKMSEMDGYEVCRQLKSDDKTRKVPVIFISGLSDLSEKVKGFKVGGVDYIPKPFEAEEVLARVRTHLHLKALTESLEQMVSQRTQELTRLNRQLKQEIDDRKKAEKALGASERNLRVIFDQAFQFNCLLTPDGTVVQVNRTALDFAGIKEADATGRPFWETIWWRHSKPLQERLKTAIAKAAAGEVVRFEGDHQTLEGNPHYVDISVKPVRDEGGHVTFLISESRDITERKLAEKEKKELESRLRQAMKMEAIGTLAGGIAHDFNNILSAIMGFTELSLMEDMESSELEANLVEVLNATGRAKDLVKQILTFSRQTEQQLKPVQISLIAEEALKLLRASLPSTIDIHQNIKSNGLVMADPTQIHQLMMNLCTNAGHAMAEHGGTLEVRLTELEIDTDFADRHPDLKPGPHLQLTVSDTGSGMSPEVLDQIFDPFFTTKDKGQGTGLGLSVVHGVVKSHGGAIHAYSVPEKGTSMKVYLPAFKRKTEVGEKSKKKLPTGTERILFVDDEQILVNVGRKTLEILGYRVTTRNSSTEALALFRSHPDRFDLVITDQTMPNMTGDELAAELIALRPEIPIIICTGFSAKVNEEKVCSMGVKALIMKPLVMQDMAETIRNVLDKK